MQATGSNTSAAKLVHKRRALPAATASPPKARTKRHTVTASPVASGSSSTTSAQLSLAGTSSISSILVPLRPFRRKQRAGRPLVPVDFTADAASVLVDGIGDVSAAALRDYNTVLTATARPAPDPSGLTDYHDFDKVILFADATRLHLLADNWIFTPQGYDQKLSAIELEVLGEYRVIIASSPYRLRIPNEKRGAVFDAIQSSTVGIQLHPDKEHFLGMAPFTLSIEVLTAVLQEAEVSRVAVEFYGMKRPATQAWNKFADIVNYASHSSHSDEFKVLVDIGTYIVSNESELLTADKASCDVFGFKITENGVPRFDSKCLNFTIFLFSFKSCHLS